MRVLYISHHREMSGWGEAARNYILALDSVGVDIAIRPITLGQASDNMPIRILELEKKPIKGCDIVIQHVLPKFMDFDGNLYNIGLYVTENDLGYTEWPAKLKCMDELWVPNFIMKWKHKRIGINVPTNIFCHPFNISRYEKVYPKLDLNSGGDYLFYTIGEFNTRKDLESTLRAFHGEFSPNEPVSLVIKTSVPGKSPEESKEIVKEYCNNVKRKMKMYKNIEDYKQEIIICGHMPEDDIMSLHATCNCFVSSSHAEAWNMPAFDAMAMGNKHLLSQTDGHKEYSDFINTDFDDTFGSVDTFEDMSTSREKWGIVNVSSLRLDMRDSYMNMNRDVNLDYIKNREQFSYTTIGNEMKKRLEEIYDSSN